MQWFSLLHSFSDSDLYLSEIPLFESKTCHLFKLQQVFCRLVLKANDCESALCLQWKLTAFRFQQKKKRKKKCNVLDPHLLVSIPVAGFQLQNLLKAADGSHSVAQRQVALALTQMTLWDTSVKLPVRGTFTCSAHTQQVTFQRSHTVQSFTLFMPRITDCC